MGGWVGFLTIKLVAENAATRYSLWAMAGIIIIQATQVLLLSLNKLLSLVILREIFYSLALVISRAPPFFWDPVTLP